LFPSKPAVGFPNPNHGVQGGVFRARESSSGPKRAERTQDSGDQSESGPCTP